MIFDTLDPVGFTRDCNDWLAFFRGRHSSSVLHTIYSQVNLLATFQCYRVMLVGILSLKIGVVKVRQFQNEYLKSSFLRKYERKIVRISAMCSEGRNLDNFLFLFWEKRWLQIFILKMTDLYVNNIWTKTISLLIRGNSISLWKNKKA